MRNPFGQELYTKRLTCRTIFTDPNTHQELHDNHVQNFNNYYGYWYKEDLYAYDARTQAILQNGLIEATLAGGWISVLLWVGSLIFIIIQKTYIRKEKNKFDRFSETNTMMEGSMRRGQHEGSVMSGSGYYPGNGSMFNRSDRIMYVIYQAFTFMFYRGGLRGSNQSMKSVRSKKDMDELAFASLGLSHTGTLPSSGYNSGHATPGAAPGHQPVPGYFPQQQQQFIPQQQFYPPQQTLPYQAQAGNTYLHDVSNDVSNMETEIM